MDLSLISKIWRTVSNGLCICGNDGLIFGWAYIWTALSVSNSRWAYAREGSYSKGEGVSYSRRFTVYVVSSETVTYQFIILTVFIIRYFKVITQNYSVVIRIEVEITYWKMAS